MLSGQCAGGLQIHDGRITIQSEGTTADNSQIHQLTTMALFALKYYYFVRSGSPHHSLSVPSTLALDQHLNRSAFILLIDFCSYFIDLPQQAGMPLLYDFRLNLLLHRRGRCVFSGGVLKYIRIIEPHFPD